MYMAIPTLEQVSVGHFYELEKFCPKRVSPSLLYPRQFVATRFNLHKVCAQLERFPMLFCEFYVQT